MKITIEQVEVTVKKEKIYYLYPCCPGMERVVQEDSYDRFETGNWDDIRKAIKKEIDKGERYSIVKYCPYCGAKIEWEGGRK